MPTLKFEKLAFDKRATILEAAGRQFADHGYDSETLDHILEHTGISKAQAYQYFENKADLFACVAEHFVNRVLEESDELISKLNGIYSWDRLNMVVKDASRDYESHEILHSLEYATDQSSELRANLDLKAQYKRVHQSLAVLFRKGQEAGLLRTDLPFDLLLNLYHAIHDAASRWWVRNMKELDSDEMERVTNLLFDLNRTVLSPPPGSGGKEEP